MKKSEENINLKLNLSLAIAAFLLFSLLVHCCLLRGSMEGKDGIIHISSGATHLSFSLPSPPTLINKKGNLKLQSLCPSFSADKEWDLELMLEL